jgi:hypothetical protein
MRVSASLVICAAQVACNQHAPSPPVATSETASLAAVTGATIATFVAGIPDERRRELAYQLIRRGDLGCPRVESECEPTTMAEAANEATIDDPCTRRELILELLGQRSEREEAVPPDVLGPLAMSRDIEMIDRFASELPALQRIDLAVAMEAAGDDAEFVLSDLSPEQAADAVRRRHLGAAIERLDPDRDEELLLAVVGDAGFTPRARLDAIAMLRMRVPDPLAGRSPKGERLAAAVAPLTGSEDCRLAAAAAELRWELVDDSADLPVRPRTRDPAEMMRRICVLSRYHGYNIEDLVATYVPRGGMAVTYPAGHERVASRSPAHTRLSADDPELLRILELIGDCSGTTCDAVIARIKLTFAPDRRGDLALVGLQYDRDVAAEEALDACDPGGGGD